MGASVEFGASHIIVRTTGGYMALSLEDAEDLLPKLSDMVDRLNSRKSRTSYEDGDTITLNGRTFSLVEVAP